MENMKKLLTLTFVFFFLISFASAFDFNEIEFTIDSSTTQWGKYEIYDSQLLIFRGDKLATYDLIENSYSPLDGLAKIDVELFTEERILADLKVYDKFGNEVQLKSLTKTLLFEKEIIEYQPIYEKRCEDILSSNGTISKVCEDIEIGKEEIKKIIIEKINYNDEIMPYGKYTLILKGKRDSVYDGSADWIITTGAGNKELKEWAVWWNNNWISKQQLNYTENIAIRNTFIINHSANMQSDFDDIRFLDSTETIVLNHTIRNKVDGDFALITVNSLGEDSIWMYFNNPSATSTSSASDVYLNPTSFWYLDGQTGDVTDAIGINNGTNTGSTRGVAGNINNSFSFDGTNDNVSFGNIPQLEGVSAEYTIQVWTRNAPGSNVVIFSYDDDGALAQGDDIYMYWDNINVNAAVGGSAQFVTGITDITDGNWHQIVLVKNATAAIIYEDGFIKNTDTTTGDAMSANYVFTLAEGHNINNWGGLEDEAGIWNYALSASDVLELFNSSEINYTLGDEQLLDILAVTLNSPVAGFNTTVNAIEFNCSATEAINLSLIIDDVFNFTIFNTTTSQNLTLVQNITFIDEGDHNWTCQGCNNDRCSIAEARDFSIHSTPATITILEPLGLEGAFTLGDNQTLRWILTEIGQNISDHVKNCSFIYNGVETQINTTVCFTTNETSFLYVQGINNLTFTTTEEFGIISTNTTFWDYSLLEINQTFNNLTTEGSQETFGANIILANGLTISEAIFNYNNTNFTTNIIFSGGEYLVTSSILIPSVEESTNFSFLFHIIVGNKTFDLKSFNQSVININISPCSPGDNLLLNMSLKDEITKELIVGNIEVNAQAISKTSDVTVGSTGTNFSNISFGEICLSPFEAFQNLLLDVEIKYSSDGYAPELYHIQKADMSEYPKNLSLFDLANNLSTEFLVKYQDDDLISVEGAIIQLQRKYISEDLFEIVEAPLTSDIGTSIVHVDLNTNKYQATVVKDGEVLDIFPNLVFNCENPLSGQCTENLFGKIDPQNDVNLIQLRDFAFSISSVNNTITTLFAIPSGTPSSVNILLTQVDQFGNETQCDQTIVSSGGSVDCTFDDTIGDSFLELAISKDAKLQAQESFIVLEDSGLDFLENNYIIVIIFLLSIVGMGFSSPEWMIINGVFTMFIAGSLWLLNGLNFVMGFGSLIYLLVGAGILIKELSKQEDR